LSYIYSYKEQSSDETTDEDDIVDASEPADDVQSQEEENAETIEKVLRHRIGRKGGQWATSAVICH
jgi:hypothetical protein